jgi:hypothetical protein
MKMHTLTHSASACAAAALAVVAVVGGGMERAHAAEIRVLSAAAMQSIFKVIGGEFEASIRRMRPLLALFFPAMIHADAILVSARCPGMAFQTGLQ